MFSRIFFNQHGLFGLFYIIRLIKGTQLINFFLKNHLLFTFDELQNEKMLEVDEVYVECAVLSFKLPGEESEINI